MRDFKFMSAFVMGKHDFLVFKNTCTIKKCGRSLGKPVSVNVSHLCLQRRGAVSPDHNSNNETSEDSNTAAYSESLILS